jgi:Zn-dependent M28 family amino/carboxypeptidase
MDVNIERLKRQVRHLAGGPRAPESPSLERARDDVERALEETGWRVTRHEFRADFPSGPPLCGVNLIATHAAAPGVRASRRPRFCLGAHLDSRPETPGADDNASGVAALLEVARLLPAAIGEGDAVDVELAVFDLEEAGMLGGAEHAQRLKSQRVDLRGMVALEMIAYCDRRPGSQALPKMLKGRYPDTGDFIAVIGNQISGPLIAAFGDAMRRVPGLPVETLAVDHNGEYLQASRLSDHSPFWDAGFPALMITDTSFLRNPHYHQPSDTPETLDFEFLARVTQGTLLAVREILARGLPPL